MARRRISDKNDIRNVDDLPTRWDASFLVCDHTICVGQHFWIDKDSKTPHLVFSPAMCHCLNKWYAGYGRSLPFVSNRLTCHLALELIITIYQERAAVELYRLRRSCIWSFGSVQNYVTQVSQKIITFLWKNGWLLPYLFYLEAIYEELCF